MSRGGRLSPIADMGGHPVLSAPRGDDDGAASAGSRDSRRSAAHAASAPPQRDARGAHPQGHGGLRGGRHSLDDDAEASVHAPVCMSLAAAAAQGRRSPGEAPADNAAAGLACSRDARLPRRDARLPRRGAAHARRAADSDDAAHARGVVVDVVPGATTVHARHAVRACARACVRACVGLAARLGGV